MINLIKIVPALALGLLTVSCGATNGILGDQNYPNQYPNQYPNAQYPNSNGTVYRTSDGTVYRQGDVYRDQNGNVYQNGRVVRTGDVYGQPGVIARNGGNNNVYYPNQNQRNLPPGQAKKVYGGRAKDYAPGQMKKRNGNWNNNNGNWNNNDDDRDHDRYKGKNKGKGHDKKHDNDNDND